MKQEKTGTARENWAKDMSRQLTGEETPKTKKPMKRSSNSAANREMQIKTTRR